MCLIILVNIIGVTELITLFESTVITEGSTTTLLCEAIGYPPPTVVWNRFNGILSDRVSMSDSVSVPTRYGNVTRVSVNLTITNASREDTGVYTCSANNSIGSDSKNVNITIQCKFDNVCYISQPHCACWMVTDISTIIIGHEFGGVLLLCY